MILDESLNMLARDPDAPLDLAALALFLAKDEFPFLDVDGYLKEIDAMAFEVRRLMHGHLSLKVQVLVRYLFHEVGFRGNAKNYYDPNNSYLNEVLDRRLGIPITLSAIMIAVGTRAGLTMGGVGLPGHFVVKASEDDQEILVDPFHGGRILSLTDCENLVRQVTGFPFEASPMTLQSSPVGWIVQRMLNNLRSIYLKQEEWHRAVKVLARLRQLAPEDASVDRDSGLCWFHLHQPGKALGPLRAYLRRLPEGAEREQTESLVRQTLRKLAEWN